MITVMPCMGLGQVLAQVVHVPRDRTHDDRAQSLRGPDRQQRREPGVNEGELPHSLFLALLASNTSLSIEKISAACPSSVGLSI